MFILCESALATVFIHSQTDVDIELTGFNSFSDISLFHGNIAAETNREIDTVYRGLALLVFKDGQTYPVIIGDYSFTIEITGSGQPPSFSSQRENDFFYRELSGDNLELAPTQYSFARLMIQAKQLLKSSHGIKTVTELSARKKEFHEFVGEHYHSLKHSDMVRRIIDQYFMMHEYVNYHSEGAPASDIRIKYQQAVLEGVGNWLELLSPHIPDHEILNYCVSLYYKRSMVSLASTIMNNFQDIAYCPGSEDSLINLADDLLITGSGKNREVRLGDIKGDKVISFVSDDCPVSMVATVTMVRKLAAKKINVPIIVAPLEKLSEKHLDMNRMINGGNMLFIDDEKWRKEDPTKSIRLPLFQRIGDRVE